MAGRKVMDAADARACLAEARRSGLGRRDWARANGVDARSLNAWWLNLGGRQRRAAVPLRLVELVATASLASARYVVRLGGIEVEVDDRFDEDVLRRLLAVVASC